MQESNYHDAQRENSNPWKVVLYNDNRANITDVAYHIQHAIASSNSHAIQLALTAHKRGQVDIYKGSFFDCQEVADDLREIGLKTEIVG